MNKISIIIFLFTLPVSLLLHGQGNKPVPTIERVEGTAFVIDSRYGYSTSPRSPYTAYSIYDPSDSTANHPSFSPARVESLGKSPVRPASSLDHHSKIATNSTYAKAPWPSCLTLSDPADLPNSPSVPTMDMPSLKAPFTPSPSTRDRPMAKSRTGPSRPNPNPRWNGTSPLMVGNPNLIWAKLPKPIKCIINPHIPDIFRITSGWLGHGLFFFSF